MRLILYLSCIISMKNKFMKSLKRTLKVGKRYRLNELQTVDYSDLGDIMMLF